MTAKEKLNIYEKLAGMNDEVLKNKAYDAIEDCLGSEAEIMMDRGYPPEDIEERMKYEKYLAERSEIITRCCISRGIELFEEK